MTVSRKCIAVGLVVLLAVAVGAVALGCGSSGSESESESSTPSITGPNPQIDVNNPSDPAKQAARESNLRTIDAAIQVYYTETGTYPTDISQLVPTYLRSIPNDPLGGTYYVSGSSAAVR